MLCMHYESLKLYNYAYTIIENSNSDIFSNKQLFFVMHLGMLPFLAFQSIIVASAKGLGIGRSLSLPIGRPRPMMMPPFSASSRFSDRGRKGAPLFSVSIQRLPFCLFSSARAWRHLTMTSMRVSIVGDTLIASNSWMVHFMENPIEMDDDWG